MSFAVNTLSTLNRTQSAMNTSIQKIATGSQYPSASYGAAAYSILVNMYSNIGTLDQSNSNTQTANAMLATASGGVSSTVEALGSLQQTLQQAANGTNNASDLQDLSKTVNQTLSQINENASIQFNGKNLLDGSQSLTVAGDNGYTKVDLGNMTTQGLGLTDQNGNSKIDLSNISGSLQTVTDAYNKALDQATSLGAAQQNLSYASANYTTQQENLTAAASTSGDTDIAAEVTKLKSADTQNQLALYATKMSMHNNAAVLALLR